MNWIELLHLNKNGKKFLSISNDYYLSIVIRMVIKKSHQKQIEKLYANFFLSENNCSIDVTCIEMNMIKLCENFTIDCRWWWSHHDKKKSSISYTSSVKSINFMMIIKNMKIKTNTFHSSILCNVTKLNKSISVKAEYMH